MSSAYYILPDDVIDISTHYILPDDVINIFSISLASLVRWAFLTASINALHVASPGCRWIQMLNKLEQHFSTSSW